MRHLHSVRHLFLIVLSIAFMLAGTSAFAQNRQGASPLRGVRATPPPTGPVVLETAEQPRIRVVPVVTGLNHPWGMAFRRNGDILITERDKGTLRVVRDGELVDRNIPGVPEVFTGTRLAGLMDVAVHPEDDAIVYLTYSKAEERDGRVGATVALARGRLDAGALTEVRDVFVADGWGGGIAASRLVWAPDGTLFMSVGGAFQFADTGQYAQDPSTHFGKLLRLDDDGTAAADNPFVNDPDYLPEIYSVGHRNQLGLAFHPETSELWATENAPQGGDEANIVRPGENYGWPLASYSREYSGVPVSDTPWSPEFQGPEVMWWPSIAPSGLTFYTGEHFPAWRGNLFVGSMMVGRMQHTGHLERIVFNRQGQEIRREWLLTELKQRVRDVQQGPDGYLYVLTEEDNSVLFRIEPARAVTEVPGNILTIDRVSDPRVLPLLPTDMNDDARAVVDRYATPRTSQNALHTLARNPALADRVFPLANYLANNSTLSPRHRTLLILRTAWLTQNDNLWATHASRAAEAGLSDDEVRRVAAGPGDEWSDFEDVLVGLADQLFRNSSITDLTWDLLSEAYSLENMVDAVVTVADITTQSILFNALGIQPDESSAARLPTQTVGYRVVVPDREAALTTPRVEPAEGDGLRVSRTLGRHAAVAEQWYANPRYILDPEASRLTPHDRELLILRTGWNAQSVYEWAKHVGSVGRARDHGLDPVMIAQGADAEGWTERDLALIDAANEMYRDTTISDATWETLSEWYDPHQMMSIAWTVARYRRVSMTLNALGVQPLSDDEGFPILEGY